jgi:hypothetical protein
MDKEPTSTPDKVQLLSLDQLDGRTQAAKLARQLISALEDDLGGADRLTTSEREIVRRAALISAMAEHLEAQWLLGKGLDVGAYTALVNVQRRLLTTVGLERRARDVTPDLSRYIEQSASSGEPRTGAPPKPPRAPRPKPTRIPPPPC